MRRPPSLLLTGLPTVAVLALLLGCPSKPDRKGTAPPAAPEVPNAAAPVAPTPAPVSPVPVAPAPAPAPVALAKPRPARPRPAKAVVAKPSPPAAVLAPAPPSSPLPAAAPTAPSAPPAPPAPPLAATSATAVATAPAPPATVAPPALAPTRPLTSAPPASPTPEAALKTAAKAKASYRRLVASYGAQMALVTPTNGGLRLAAGGPSVALGLHLVWNLPLGLQLRPRLDYTVFASETRSSTAPPLPQTLDTKVSSLALAVDLLLPLSPRWSLGLAVAEIRWSVASTNTVAPTLGGSMTLSGTSNWTRLAVGPVLTFKVSEHLDVEARVLNGHFGYQNQPANTATLGLLWRF